MNNNIENPRDLVTVRKEKSRNLGIYEFYKILQLEAIVAELRAKIYPRIKDKNFWRKVYENKKKTVFDISERNKVNGIPLPSIFTDGDQYEAYKKEIFGDGGYPKFIYKDKDQEQQQGFYDCINYYAKGSNVACKYLDDIKIGTVKYYQPYSKNVTVILENGETVELEIKSVTRIL